MALKNHKLISVGNVHIPYTWTYADAAGREGASGLIASDEGKFARQLDDDSIWMLTDYSTPEWMEIGGGGNTHSHDPSQSSESEGESSQSTTEWIDKLELEFTANTADYKCIWYAEMHSDHSNTRVGCRVRINDSIVAAEISPLMYSSEGSAWISFSGCKVYSLQAGTNKFSMEYKSYVDGKSVHIRRARIVAMKVTVA